MTILDKTSTRLVVQASPNWGKLLMALFMLLFSSFVALAGQSTVFACQRNDGSTGQCTLTEYRLIGTTAQSFRLDAIQAAHIVTHTVLSRGSPTIIFDLMLKTSGGDFRLAANNHPEQYQAADRINAFLLDPGQRALEIKPNASMDILPFWLLFVATTLGLGGSALLISTYIFDQATGQLTVRKQWLLATTSQYPLDEISDLELEIKPATRRQRKQEIVHIVLKSGLRLTTSLPYELSLISTIRSYLKPAKPPHASAETSETTRPAPKSIRRVKYRRAKRTNHAQ